MKYRRTNPNAAATAIQSAYRGHLVRRTRPLKHLRIIRSVRAELRRLNLHFVGCDGPRLFDALRRDPAERLKWSEGAMALLLQLDSMQGVHPTVRDHRKSLTKDVLAYQEYIDSAGTGGGHSEPPVPQVPVTTPPVYGSSSSFVSMPRVPYSAPAAAAALVHGVRGERVGVLESEPESRAEEVYYPPPQAPSRYEYDARFPPDMELDMIDLFRTADVDGSGAIDTKELQRILSLKFFNFSRRTVRLMLHLFSDDTTVSSRLGPSAFARLWKELRKWQRTFKSFDNDGSGNIDLPKLREAMLSLGIGVTPQVLQLLVFNYDRSGQNSSIAFGDFIECGLIVKGLTEKFILHDPQYTGAAKIDYQAFMMMVLPFIVA